VAQYPPQQYQYYPPPNHFGYSYPPPNQYGYQQPRYPPNQYSYRYPPNQYSYPPQYNYPPLPNHHSHPHPPQHSISNYQWQGVPQYCSYPSPHQGSYPIQHHHASHQAASSRTYPTAPVSHDNRVFSFPPHIKAEIQKQLLEAERKETERKEAERKRNEAAVNQYEQLLKEEKKKQMASWLLQCMQFTPEVVATPRTGTWDDEEKIRLLLGIFLFGYSNWKSIQQVVSTRTNKQVQNKANNWIPHNMSNIEATGILSSFEEVQAFHRQTLPKVESIINQLEKKNHTDKEVNKKRWQELCAQGSEQAQQLLPNESESASSSSVSFNLGSTHLITSNLNPDKIINIECAKSIFQNYMIRELEGRLESGTTVFVTNIIRRTEEKRIWSEVVYKVVKIEDFKLPATVVSSSASSNKSRKKIKVPGYTFPSSVNARYHVSLGDLLKIYGKASLQHLYNLDEVASLDTAKRVDLMNTKNPSRRRGGVYTFKFNKDSSLPLSPIMEEEEEFSEDKPSEDEEEFSGDELEEEEFSDDDDEPEDENEEKEDKHGMTGSFGGRHDWYLSKGKNGEMYIRIDGEDLSIEGDAGLCKLYDLLMNDVKNDLRIPPWIKRALSIMLHERGGDRFGAKKNIVYLLLEMALQLKDEQSVPGEMFQWDDTVFIGMVTKLMEALDALEPLFAHFPKLRGIITAAMMSWPPCKDEDDRERVYNKPTATEYTGVDSMRDAFDGPANPDAKTHEERYSIAYTMKQFNNAIDEIIDFVQEALKCVLSGCVFLLDKNDLACDKTRENLHDIITSQGFEKVASVYEHPNDIIIYMKGNAMIVVHGPLCVGGTIMVKQFTVDDMLQRCLVIDTLRGIVCMAKGEEFNGPYLAIEAGMMQKLLVKGLHLSREYGVPAAFFREYLNTSKAVKRLGAVPKKVTTKKCFDLYANGKFVHFLEYPISHMNRERYRRYNK